MLQYNIREEWFSSFDETKLFYRAWEPKATKNKKALILIHRGHEHSGRLNELAEKLAPEGSYCFGFDGRGHGKSPGERGYADDFSYLVKDLDTFVKMISEKYEIPVQDMIVVANSVGAVIASTWVHDYAPCIRGMVLAAPAFKIKLYVPLAIPGLRVLNAVKKPAFISSYVKSRFLTHDKNEQKKYDEDSLITPQIAVNILLGLHDNAQRILSDAEAIDIPTLVLSAGSDWVVDNKSQRKFFDKLSSKDKEFVSYPGLYHGLLYEKDREDTTFKKAKEFIDRISSASLVEDKTPEDIAQYTREEYSNLLKKPLNIGKSLTFGMMRLGMMSLGRLSKGIRIGLESGFDSGVSLDHVYRNRAEGFSFIGKIIDYFYINAIGWRGIRQRKVHLEDTLSKTISELVKKGEPVRVMDIAAGPGRYLIETAKKFEDHDVKFLIKDYENKNLDQGRNIAKEYDCKNVSFEEGDAFDHSSLNSDNFKANIVIVSGLYELYDDNKLINRSISGIKKEAAENAVVIYTGQPWHPQLEMIAHTLNNRNGDRWVMRRRTQQEIDQLFGQEGFQKVDMKIDKWGIFTVSKSLQNLETKKYDALQREIA